jgi:hypothetical protein
MADYRRTATGDWSNLAQWQVWNGSAWVAAVALPGAADRCFANNFTTTLDSPATITVAELNSSNSGPAGLTNGGGFRFGATDTLNADGRMGSVNTATISNLTGTIKTVNGNMYASNTANITGGALGGSYLIFNGIAYGGTLGGNVAIRVSNYCNLTGTFNGGSGFISHGLQVDGIDNIINGIANAGVANGVGGISFSSSATNNIAYIIANGGTAVSNGVRNEGTGNNTVVGVAIGGSGGSGAINALTGTLYVTKAVAGSGGSGVEGSSLGGLTVVEEAEDNINGCQALRGFVRFVNTGTITHLITRQNGTQQLLVEPGADYPTTTDVRNGVTYASGALTGTLVVPSPSNVRQGVPTDNTVGTAALTPADFWDYLTSSATPGSMGARVAAIPTNPASVESTGAQIASFNT